MLYCGTSGWAYPAWKPGFYPANLATRTFLRHYASRLNSVEVNYTFRRLPTETLLGKWMDDTPDGFRFAIKAHQAITHFRRLRDAAEPCSRFLAAIKPLRAGDRLGPVLLQLPPNLKCDLPLLDAFLRAWPPDHRTAIEFRHDSWFGEDTYTLLRAANVALCQAQTEDMETPAINTANFAYFRYRKDSFSELDRGRLASRLASAQLAGDAFIYFKHEDTPSGALWAETFLRSGAPN